jgi:hypothetical protein
VLTSRAYAFFPCCLPFRAGDVELPLDFLADMTRPIHSDPNNYIINRFLIEPSADSDLIDPIQLPNFIFDLCDIHDDCYLPNPLKDRAAYLTRPHTFLDGLQLLLHIEIR